MGLHRQANTEESEGAKMKTGLKKTMYIWHDKGSDNCLLVDDSMDGIEDGVNVGVYELVRIGVLKSQTETWLEAPKKAKAKRAKK